MKNYLNNLCYSHDIVFIQEYWLLPDNLDIIRKWSNDWGSHVMSGVADIEKYVMTGGRSYGGTGFSWNKQVLVKVVLLAVDTNHSLMAVEVTCDDKYILHVQNLLLVTMKVFR